MVRKVQVCHHRQKPQFTAAFIISQGDFFRNSYVAQAEREFIHQRQAEGIAVAKAQGVRLGRPPLAQPKEFPAVHQAWLKKEISAREAAWRLSVTHKTFLRRAQKL